MRYGEKLKKYREMRGLTQAELAEQANATRSHIAMIERGSRTLSLEVAAKCADALHVSVMDFLTDNSERG